jgi:serine/threonine protein kinase
MECPSCHSQIDPGKFCPACGTALSAPAPTAVEGQGRVSSPSQAPAPADPLVGQTLGGKYRVVRLLGEGGMGCVYQGEQMLGTKARKVAIKTLHPHLSKDAKILARFEREVGTVAELEHPNTIQVYDFGKTESGILYIVMEFVHGQNLAETLEKGGAMEPARVEKIMNQVCGSLEEAHGRGIIHRDLKPDNIVLTERAGSKDFVKVLDFGIAKRSNEEDRNETKLTQQGMVLGTPPYMSPEQFTGKPIDARSDIYSLAIMAYEMLTANLPFEANTAWEWATQHMTAQPRDIDTMPFHERIPVRMKNALRQALQKEPDNRFPTVRHFFDAFSGGAAANATPVDAGQPAIGAGPAAAQAKGRTEIASPMDLPGRVPSSSYGQNPAPPYGPNPGPQGGTPALGNVAFPTPNAGIAQPPPMEADTRGGGNRGVLLGIAAVVGVLSVAAIGVAIHGGIGSGSGHGDPPAPSPPPTQTVVAAPDAEAPAPSASNDDSLGKLLPPGATSAGTSSGGHPTVHHDAGAKEPTSPLHGGVGHPPGEPPACQQASLMRRAGNVTGYQQLKAKCEAAGGTVPP